MKLKYELTIMDMGDEYAAVPVGADAEKFHGMLKLNRESADILEHLKEDTDTVTIHKYIKGKYPDMTDDEIEHILADFLNKLVQEGLLIP